MVDVIAKPFDPDIVKTRVNNAVELFQRRLNVKEKSDDEALASDFLQALYTVNRSIIDTDHYSSGGPVSQISNITRILLENIMDEYPEYNLTNEKINDIAEISVLYDIGHLSVPEGILKKKGKLTNEEMKVMREHCQHGCDILYKFSPYLDKKMYCYGYDICRSHHERWDGSGLS